MKTLTGILFFGYSLSLLAATGNFCDDTLPGSESCYISTESAMSVKAVIPSDSKILLNSLFMSAIPLPDTDGNLKPSVNHENCVEEKDCKITSTPLAVDYADFVLNFSKFNSGKHAATRDEQKNKCECLREKYVGANLEEKLKEEKSLLNKKILQAYSKKFLNDFATNLEDMSFFLTRNRDMFLNDENAKGYQCNNPEKYNDIINLICSKKGIVDPAFIKQRKDFFINSLDGGSASFEKRLPQMALDIQAIKYPGSDDLFSRVEYDDMRLGMAHSSPMAKAVDHIVLKIMQNPKLAGMLQIDMANNPVQGILITIEKNKTDPEFISQFDQSIVGDMIKDQKKLHDAFSFLMNTHPGFLNVMEDRNAFENLDVAVSKGNVISILDSLENNSSILEPTLLKRCNNMMAEFANAVCTNEDDLVSKMDSDDLENLIHSQDQDEKNNVLHEILVCEKTINGPSDDKFKNLSKLFDPKIPPRKADFLERLTEKDVLKHTNPFTKAMLNSKDKDTRAAMEDMATKGTLRVKAVSGGGIVALTVHAQAVVEGKIHPLSKHSMTKEAAKSYLAENRKYKARQLAEKKSHNSSSKTISHSETRVVPENISSDKDVVPAKNTQVAMPAKTQLAQKLSKTYPNQQVEKVLTNVSNNTAEELNRLRQGEANLLQREYEFETKRMADIQRRVEELQNKVSQPQTQNSRPVKNGQSSSSMNDSTSGTETRVRQKVAAIAPISEQKETTAKVNSQNSFASADLNSEPSNSLRAKTNPKTQTTQSVPINLPAALTVNEIPSDKINEEVGKLLESSALDDSTLDEIKAKGIKVKVAVMENDKQIEKEITVKFADLDQKTKNLIELKFAKKERDQQVSKLAVLRMLMGRYQDNTRR